MRGNIRAAVLVLASAAVLLTGCGRPPGVDGDLTNDWPAMPEPKLLVPTAPSCYAAGDLSAVTVTTPVMSCASDITHDVETFYVGQFAGADADRMTPPPSGGPERRRAYHDCDRVARDFLGDDWRFFRVGLSLGVPSDAQWEAGARWFRCDVAVFTDSGEGRLAPRTNSLKGALAGDEELRITCQHGTEAADKSITMEAAWCGSPHNVEFAGVADAPDEPFPADQKAQQEIGARMCPPVVARFVGVPADDDFQYRTGWASWSFPRDEWELGERGIRCYVWTDKDVTGSLKGAGPKVLPVH